ncbi:MAG TPA: cupredoxin domain-containing protein [Candidatus Binataceae bacterium]|nr:cupredoxin domain-containing protein [Candidatus Binataceae bacterium]
MLRTSIKFLLSVALVLSLTPSVLRADDPPLALNYQNGRFEPNSLPVPANKAFKIAVTNHGSTAIEFESFELHRERVVAPGETITVFIPALAPGNYNFFDDFHHDAPQGVIVAK